MSKKVSVVCPNCSSTASYLVTVDSGTSTQQCQKCRKSFRITMKKGSVDRVDRA